MKNPASLSIQRNQKTKGKLQSKNNSLTARLLGEKENMTPNEFLLAAFQAAISAKHIFPEYAACEAALESAWGKSQLAIKAQNLFGRKQSHPPVFDTLDMPTHEYVHGEMVPVMAHWVKYPDWASCFDDRMALLRRLSVVTNEDGSLKFPEYLDALNSQIGESFVVNVSKKWSTDPLRATKVLQIYAAHKTVFPALSATS